MFWIPLHIGKTEWKMHWKCLKNEDFWAIYQSEKHNYNSIVYKVEIKYETMKQSRIEKLLSVKYRNNIFFRNALDIEK